MTSRSNRGGLGGLLLAAVLLLASPALAAGERTVLYLDGARVEATAVVRKGVAAVILPPGLVPGSLRVEPLNRTVIDQVLLAPPPVARDAQRERRSLDERREALEDRLAALAVKEEVFKAAAKSQSGRAPKRTKTNPEPLATIRQGTDYAVAQLEAVYRARRPAERELVQVKKRLAALSGDPTAVGTLARISVHGGDQVRVSYLVRDRKWVPAYDLQLLGNGGAQLVVRSDEAAKAVVPASLTAPTAANELMVGAGGIVAKTDCSVGREEQISTAQPTVRAELTCPTIPSLPAGVATCFYRGQYLGRLNLPGITPGTPLSVICGTFGETGAQAPATTAK